MPWYVEHLKQACPNKAIKNDAQTAELLSVVRESENAWKLLLIKTFNGKYL